MEFDWLNSILTGILTGAASVLPVSVEAHQRLLLKFMGMHEIPVLTALTIHLGVAAALYLCCLNHILKMTRASRLARIPKRKRKRPLDTRSLMDLSLLKTMLLPVVLAFFLYEKVSALVSNFIVMAAFLFVNGLLLYIPQFLPTSNKDCRTLSRVEGLLMGLGGGLFVVPGLSGVGTALSGASICGVDRKYGLEMVLLMNLGLTAGRIVLDVWKLISVGGVFSIPGLLFCLLGALCAFGATYGCVKFMRHLAGETGFAFFAYYSWGMALFTFILSLMA